MHIQKIKVQDIQDSNCFATLCEENVHELREGRSINIDWSVYAELEKTGNVFGLGMFVNGTLVGYSTCLTTQHPHYAHTKVCINDALYLLPEFRKGRFGLALLKSTEDAAKETGCTSMQWHAKPDSQLYKLLGLLKYTARDIIYEKDL